MPHLQRDGQQRDDEQVLVEGDEAIAVHVKVLQEEVALRRGPQTTRRLPWTSESQVVTEPHASRC